MTTLSLNTVDRAAASYGGSSEPIYRMVDRILTRLHPGGGTLLDVGCGQGALLAHVGAHIDEYIGADVIRYKDFPGNASFIPIDLDAGRVPLPDGSAEVVVSVETIEHLENPRAFFRELHRLAKPGGLIVLTTPNQLSLLSKLTFLTKNHFNAFQEGPGLYPSHITALLETDLIRIAREAGISEIEITYSDRGRLPLTTYHWPTGIGCRGRRFSDNVAISGSKA